MQRGCLHSVGRTTHNKCIFYSYIVQAFLILSTRLDRKCLALCIKTMQEAIVGYVLATLRNRAIMQPRNSYSFTIPTKINNFTTFLHLISLPFSVRRQINNCVPDFSVRQKKILLRKRKMDIYCFLKMSKMQKSSGLL